MENKVFTFSVYLAKILKVVCCLKAKISKGVAGGLFLRSQSGLLLLLLLLSHFSRVRLCATPQMAAHQAPLSLGFSRQEHWSRLPFSSPMHESETEVSQSCPTLRDPLDCSLPGSSIHGIFQARILEWVAIAFSAEWFKGMPKDLFSLTKMD